MNRSPRGLLRNDAIAMPRHHVGDTNAAVNTRGGLSSGHFGAAPGQINRAAVLPMIRKGTLLFVIAKQQLQKCPVQNRLLPVRRDR
jgi:hypothetical protein